MKDNLVYLRQIVDYIDDIEEYVRSQENVAVIRPPLRYIWG